MLAPLGANLHAEPARCTAASIHQPLQIVRDTQQARPYRRHTVDQRQISICVPSSTTRFGGILKNSVADRAFRAMIAKSTFRHRAILM